MSVPAVQPTELIKIKQLPIIEEQLKVISADIQAQRDEALALEATDANVALVRKKRAELNKTFKDLESRRIAVKKAVMAPYDEFEAVYKKHVTDVCKPADEELKSRIDKVDRILIEEKAQELKTYLESELAEKNIDFVSFDSLGLKINRSASVNKLKEQIDDELAKVTTDLTVIESMEHSPEILVEYRQNRDLAQSVLKVNERKEHLAELEKQKQADLEKQKAEEARKQTTASAPERAEPELAEEVVIADPVAHNAEDELPFVAMPFEDDSQEEPAPQITTTVITITVLEEAQVKAITGLCDNLGVEYTTSKEVV